MVDARFAAIDVRVARVDEQFGGLGRRLDAMDRDIKFLTRRKDDHGLE